VSLGEPIRHSLAVRCDPQRAFELFTRDMGSWWPLESYSRAWNEFGGTVRSRLEFHARLGGPVLEHLEDGTVLPWGEVIEWDPPHRVVLAWRPHSQPEPPTELEVTFARGGNGTRVELEHRAWDRLSNDFRELMYDTYVRGWASTLELFVAAADRRCR
jgi:uncharacterized protein YndB with AHSA1/START domain